MNNKTTATDRAPPLEVKVDLSSPLSPLLMAWSKEIGRMMAEHYPCGRCGDCCQKMDKIVIQDSDIDRIPYYLKLTRREFKTKYLRRAKGIWYLKESERCAFLAPDNVTCTIHSVRPSICQAYPYQTPWFTKVIYDSLKFVTEGGDPPHLVVHMGEECPCRVNLKERLRDTTSEFLSDVSEDKHQGRWPRTFPPG